MQPVASNAVGGDIASDDELITLFSKVQDAERLRLNREFDKAIAIAQELVRKHPDYVGALQTLGLSFADKGDLEKAQTHLNRAVMLNPKDWRTLTALSGVYLQLGATALAAVTLEQARKLKPEDAGLLLTLGEIYREEREYELAADAHQKASQLDPSLHDALLGFGLSCTQLGRNEEAARAFETHLAIYPDDLSTVFSLTHLPSSVVKVNLLESLQNAERKGKIKEKFQGSFAYSKTAALDKAKRHAEAWEILTTANRSLWNAFRQDAADDAETRRDFLAFAQKFPAKVFADQSINSPISLFILGPSRSGKTTLENIVASLDGVKRGYENPIVENAVRRTFQTAGLITRDRLVELPPGLDQMFLDLYLENLKERAAGAKVFTNTHPGRIFDVLRLASALPNTRFLFVKRDLDDITLRMFMKRYHDGHFYSYDLETARQYVTWYYDMIDMCAAKLPSLCRVIQYEKMIEDPSTARRTAADLCGLSDSGAGLASVGDDRGAAEAYRQFIAETLKR